MIAKILLFIIAVLIMTACGLDHCCRPGWRGRLLLWSATAAAVFYSCMVAFEPGFVPDNIQLLFAYLAFLFILVIPLALFTLCLFIGQRLGHRLIGRNVGLSVALLSVVIYLYGAYVGFSQIRVNRIEYVSEDIPATFDGYRILQFSDAHVGSYVGFRQRILAAAVDSINAQHADMIVFTGDLQNKKPQEIEEHEGLLRSIQAPDGVFSVLGNHDYTDYLGTDDQFERSCQMSLSVGNHHKLGWTLLRNAHQIVRRGSDSIVIAGMENDGEGRFPQLGDVRQTLKGVSRHAFVVMLEHDPTSWRRKILPYCHAQLTLSGHTHGGQISLLGWSPAALRYKEYVGMYHHGGRALYVSRGLGGVVPFRLGTSGEIVVITLKRK